jgi:hypothetical protein
MHPHSQRSSFVIRIWWEQSDMAAADPPAWRGWVQHTHSGEAAYVRSLEELIRFLERWAGKLARSDKGKAGLK